MLEEKDLQAIRSIVKEEITEAEKRIAKSTVTLMDAEFSQRFNLLAEGQEDILRRMPSEEDMDIIDGRLATLEALVKKHSREIAALKQAQ